MACAAQPGAPIATVTFAMTRAAGTLVAVFALAVAMPAHALPKVHAHRGGSVQHGKPAFPENAMPGFRNAAKAGFVLEMDVKLTRDRVPVVIHDATLDRTTNCKDEVRARKAAWIRANCRVDVIGSGGVTRRAKRGERAKVPTLREFLTFARKSGARINLEIKNVPTDPDFDDTDAFAGRVVRAIVASGMPRSRVIVQSFWPPDLEVVRSELPGVATSLLTLSAANSGSLGFAAARGHKWVSPEWPVDQSYVNQAHGLGRKVVPFTLNRAADVKAAAALGVDAVISDDPYRARRAIRG